MNEAADQNWNTRALYRQIGTLYYERLLVSQDRQSFREEASANLTALKVTPREFVRDPVMLEFLGIPNTEKLLESRLEDALIENLQSFLLDLKTTELAHQDIGQMDIMFGCMTICGAVPKIIPPSVSYCAPKKTSPSFVTQFCMATNSAFLRKTCSTPMTMKREGSHDRGSQTVCEIH
jgi:predicted nuclease of restriction endonuclease-like (RecB) superfamily